MGLESGTTIASLNPLWPLGTDQRSQGDDHLRLVKSVMKSDALSLAAGGIVKAELGLEGGSPALHWHETDAPGTGGGRYRFAALAAGSFYFQSTAVEDWSSGVNIWSYSLSSNTFIVEKPVVIAATFPSGNANIQLQGHYPGVWFSDISASGGSPNLVLTGGNSSFRVGPADTSGLITSNWATCATSSGWVAGSDERLKDNITDIGYGLDSVLALRPVQFDWKDSGRHDIGLIAQEVHLVVPEVVEEMPTDHPGKTAAADAGGPMLGLHKDVLVAVLIKAIQELSARLEALEAA